MVLMASNQSHSLQQLLQGMTEKKLSMLDFLAKGSLTERVISLALGEASLPETQGYADQWHLLAERLAHFDVSGMKVVLFGGGTGLSNIVGGDSRRPEWRDSPFTGLKEIFTDLHSIVCVTDDGGSTGEILKDFPLVALGDLRHVLLSSVSSRGLAATYQLDYSSAVQAASVLHGLFNYRFISEPLSAKQLLADSTADLSLLPAPLADYLNALLNRLFDDSRMTAALQRPQCLGNLLLASAIYAVLPAKPSAGELADRPELLQPATVQGLADLSNALGAGTLSVLPCTTTPAQLQVLYANGVLVTSECKSGAARRGYPVDRVIVDFSGHARLPEEVAELVQAADIIMMAPGSLYTSIIPILQVPGLADLIRSNTEALKLLVANIWVQKGETDATRDAPERKFHVSDLVLAYDRNISGGIQGLFSHVLTLDLADIPGSVLQNYAIEQKEPIYLDRNRVRDLGLEPVDAYIFSRALLQQRNVIQHDPRSLALVVRVLCGLRASGFLATSSGKGGLPFSMMFAARGNSEQQVPCSRYQQIVQSFVDLDVTSLGLLYEHPQPMTPEERDRLLDRVTEIIWRHPDIQPDHFQWIRGICLIDTACWKRCQEWDNVFSFFDPADGCVKIRSDQAVESSRLEMAFLVGLGQSLLGNYAAEKRLEDIVYKGETAGRVFCLQVRESAALQCFFTPEQIHEYLQLCRMNSSCTQKRLYTRLVNGQEGFTPPGLLFGLIFTWYLDNRFAPNIDYKMSIMKDELSYLIPEQVRIVGRRKQLIRFFREVVFRRHLPQVKLSS
jgi:uncharacterized cofD-like protein